MFIVAITSCSNVLAQGDYIEYDSIFQSGVKLVKGTNRDNAKYIKQTLGDQEKIFYPEDLKSYGFKKGFSYFSRNISVNGATKKVFLKRISKGKINFYTYYDKNSKLLFYETDSTLSFLSHDKKETISNLEDQFSDNAWVQSQVTLVKYNEKSVARLADMYNQEKSRPLPFKRIGIIVGLNSTNLIVPFGLTGRIDEDIKSSRDQSVSVGIFVDLPIEMSFFSFNTGLSYSVSNYSYSWTANERDYDMLVNLSSIDVPLLLRYTYPTRKMRPFVNGGVAINYNLKNDYQSYETTYVQNIIVIDDSDFGTILSEGLFGLSFGLGSQYHLNPRNIISVELRYDRLYTSEVTLEKSHLSLLFSFSI